MATYGSLRVLCLVCSGCIDEPHTADEHEREDFTDDPSCPELRDASAGLPWNHCERPIGYSPDQRGRRKRRTEPMPGRSIISRSVRRGV